MSILSTNHRLISIGESYSAGNGIDITDQVISVTGDATPYSAGENIDIQDHIISGKDWSQDITEASSHAYNETTAWVQENYANSADMTYISAVVDTKLDASAWSTVSADYATEDYVIMADNITYGRATGYVDSQQFAKESACQSAFDYLNTNKLNTEDFTAWQNGQYATDIQTIEGQISNKYDTSSFAEVSGSFQPSGDYVERDFVLSSIESATSGKLDVSSFASVSGDFLVASSLNGYATESFVENVSGEITSLIPTDYYPDTNPSGFISGVDLSPYQTVEGMTAYQEAGDYYSASNPSGFITGVDLTPYQTIEGMTAYQPVGDYTTTAEVDTLSSMLSAAVDYVSANAGDDFPQSADEAIQAYQTNSSTYLTSHQDISYLMPMSESANFYPMTGNPSGFINDVEFEEINLSSFATSSQINELSGAIDYVSAHGSGGDEEVNSFVYDNSATIDDVNTSYQTNSGTFLTAHQSLEGYAVESAFEYNGNDLITAYNGSAFAGQGGGDVPTGTMNVSGLEYNAVNEISAYNGSAIAQYGAEKQWLVHDDTLVHLSNSAQYALGVNVSALQRLMGIDETVLYSGAITTGQTATLSENISSFNKVQCYVYSHNGSPYRGIITLETDGNNIIYGACDTTWSNGTEYSILRAAFSGNKVSAMQSIIIYNGQNIAQNETITKVIGIGRKA